MAASSSVPAAAGWLQKLDLPVDEEDLRPLSSEVTRAFSIAPDTLYKSAVTINKGNGNNNRQSGSSRNQSLLQRDGKALIRFSAWSIPIRSEFKRDILQRKKELEASEEKVKVEASEEKVKLEEKEEKVNGKTGGNNDNNNGQNLPFSSVESLMSKMSEIRLNMETEDLATTSEDEEKIWDKDLRRERKVKRMLRRAKESEKKDNHNHSHCHGNNDHSHGNNDHHHHHSDHNGHHHDHNHNNMESLFRKTLIRRQGASDPAFPLLLNKKFSCPSLEACALSMKPGERAIFILSPALASSFINLECTIRSASQQAMSKCASKFMQMQELYPELMVCQGLPMELHMELIDLYFYDEGGVNDVENSVNSSNNLFDKNVSLDWRQKQAWQYSLAERWTFAVSSKEQGNSDWKAGNKVSAMEHWKKALEFIESMDLTSQITNWKDDYRHSCQQQESGTGILEPCILEPSDVTIPSVPFFNNLLNSLRSNLSLYLMLEAESMLTSSSSKTPTFSSHHSPTVVVVIDALKDVIKLCSSILTLDPSNEKALFRRAKAYRLIGRDLDLAQLDLKAIAVASQSDPAIQLEWKLLADSLARSEAAAKRAFSHVFSTTTNKS